MSRLIKVAISVSLSREYDLRVPEGYTGSLEDFVRDQVHIPHAVGFTEDEFSVINLEDEN